MKKRTKIIANVRRACHSIVDELSQRAVEETGLGRAEDKVAKNRLVIDKTPGTEILTPQAVTGDDGLALTEFSPYGVIGAITPCTNPSETVINNSIGMLAAGNSIVFNSTPNSKKKFHKKLSQQLMKQLFLQVARKICSPLLRNLQLKSHKH